MAALLFRRFSSQSIERRLLSSLTVDHHGSIQQRLFSHPPVDHHHHRENFNTGIQQRRLFASMPLLPEHSKIKVAVPERYFWKNHRGINREYLNDDEDYVHLYSAQLVEQDIDLDQVYGRIEVGCEEAFLRKLGQDRRDIDPNGYFRLLGPESPMLAIEWNTVDPHLYRGNHPGDYHHPAKVPKYKDDKGKLLTFGGRSISQNMARGFPQNQLLIRDIKTSCGSVRIAFAHFDNCADAYVTVKLLEWKEQGEGANIYGRIYASNTVLDDEGAKSLVFDKNRDEETLLVMPGDYIPLLRPSNVASMGHSLELTFSIFHKTMDSSDHHDEPILSETFSVDAKWYTEEDTGEDGIYDRFQFNGKLAKFEVKVYWLSC